MFEKFTEKAIEVVKSAQITAIELNHEKVYPEHIVLALLDSNSSGIVKKLFTMYKINSRDLRDEIETTIHKRSSHTPNEFIVFSDDTKNIFYHALSLTKQLGALYVTPEHILLAILEEPKLRIPKTLSEKGFDIEKTKNMFYRILNNSSSSKKHHPESTDRRKNSNKYDYILSLFKDSDSSAIFHKAAAKITTSEYEILGTEQIIQCILEGENTNLLQTLADFGVTAETFSQKLSELSQNPEETPEKQIIFTPNANKTLMLALETVRELGNAKVEPEHILLGLLKSKSGIAYNILKALNVNETLLEERIIRPLEKQTNQMLTVLKYAKEEAKELGTNVVGTESILLGILLEGNGIAATVLKDLGITVKDARDTIEKLLGISGDYSERDISFSQRAKIVLEDAWRIANSSNKNKIEAHDVLLAMCNIQSSLAMKTLSQLGVDVLEIRQGIKNKLDGNI